MIASIKCSIISFSIFYVEYSQMKHVYQIRSTEVYYFESYLSSFRQDRRGDVILWFIIQISNRDKKDEDTKKLYGTIPPSKMNKNHTV